MGMGHGKELWESAICRAYEAFNTQEFILWSDPHAESFYKKNGLRKNRRETLPFTARPIPSDYEIHRGKNASKYPKPLR